MTKNKGKNEIKITHYDLKFIYSDEYVFLVEKIIPNCFCATCPPPTKYSATIINYEIFINELNDNNFTLNGIKQDIGSSAIPNDSDGFGKFNGTEWYIKSKKRIEL